MTEKALIIFAVFFPYRLCFWATNNRTLISKSGECMENVSDHKSRRFANMSLGNSVLENGGYMLRIGASILPPRELVAQKRGL